MARWHWSPARRNAVSAAVAAVTLGVLATLRIADPSGVQAMRAGTFDILQRLSPREYGDPPVRVADIDEASLAAFGQWPWPRTRIAELNDRLTELGAAAIAYDVIFAEPDRTSPRRYADEVERMAGADGTAIRDLLANLPDNDERLAASLARSPAILAFGLSNQPGGEAIEAKGSFPHQGADPRTLLHTYPAMTRPLPGLVEAAPGLGSIGESNPTTVIRTVPLLYSVAGKLHPSLSLEALRVAQRARSVIVRSTGASRELDTGTPGLTGLKVGEFPVPLTGDGQIWVHFDRERPERYVSIKDILDRSKEAEVKPRLEGHVVFVGPSAAGLLDIKATPLGSTVPGVSIHAQIAEQILSGKFLARPDWSNGLEILATVAMGGLVALLLLAFGAKLALAAGALVTVAAVAASWLAFTRFGLLVDPVYPSLSALAVYLAVSGTMHVTTDRERRFVRRAFGQYLAPGLLAKLEQQPHGLALGGEVRDMSIMFMDIRGFTPISEQLSATDLVHFLNELLSPLSDAIQAEDGTIDKYIGDSIMAFWNAPVDVGEHPAHACRAALRMLEIVHRMNREDAFGFAAAGRPDLQVRIGIGINTGEACVGNMGSQRRFNYSVIGDAVNTAARIESSCKAVGADLLVSEETALRAPGFAFLEAGGIALKGKAKPVRLFALVGDEAMGGSPAFRELAGVHGRFVEAIEAGDAAAAAFLLAALRRIAPESLSDFYDRFAEQVEALVPAPLPALAEAI